MTIGRTIKQYKVNRSVKSEIELTGDQEVEEQVCRYDSDIQSISVALLKVIKESGNKILELKTDVEKETENYAAYNLFLRFSGDYSQLLNALYRIDMTTNEFVYPTFCSIKSEFDKHNNKYLIVCQIKIQVILMC